ncbi:excinuclease ABC subunit UvrA [Lactobacillus helveticus]|uniref:UvrABC system protein A n=1 Tax=Lactobacillus helveticus TaxID=1587 RepID=A0A8H9F7J3_LACHE|nr:excinuclease ABC subunit UvrA [Lactobacillus helveticus]MBW8061760.1 excinuclease ABC subunit UvrA [Lactobacillus helveticus]GFO98575.1 excinuclease ABC subunit A [Lactobacillus helveticus]GFP01050.1 excinuclease ABC subunit A [Lactobacillus helveticus]GFP03348.1 excinuclease ABC subunit A [Lactobacillus helveticus]
MALPKQIEVRGAKVHNLKNIDVNILLHKFVAISGLSGSGKSSLAMGILYEEGSRRYLDALSTYMRRRIKQGAQADVTSVKHIPSALALRQRPSVPNERANVGTTTETFNVLRLIFSRLGSPICPNGHRVAPSLAIAEAMSKSGEEMGRITCPTCGVKFYVPSAEEFAFNSDGACTECGGTGKVHQLDENKLIADENLSIEDGAVASWSLPGRNFMPSVAEHAGVRINVPFKDLTDKEKDFVLNGPEKKYKMDFLSGTGRVFHDFNALYENAHQAVLRSAKSSKSERAQKRIAEFFTYSTCPVCHGTRLRPELLKQLVNGKNIDEVEHMQLGDLPAWSKEVLAKLPEEMHQMASSLIKEFINNLQPLLDLGLDYLTMARAGNTLSTGELQRIQLARTLRTETTGVLYVLDEPSIGLHPANVDGLIKVLRKLVDQGNSLVVVDHNVDIIKAADEIIEIGPGSGEQGGQILAQGTPRELEDNKKSLIAPYLNGKADLMARKTTDKINSDQIKFEIEHYFNLHDIKAGIPVNQITAVTGFSGAGKTSLILDSLVPAIEAQAKGEKLPKQIKKFSSPVHNVVNVDATPIGKSTRSTVATYTSIMDNLRKLFARQPLAKEKHYTPSYFSYNNKEGACPTCGGTGIVTLDIQFLPDMQQTCPTCHGERYNSAIQQVKWHGMSIVDVLNLDINEALPVFKKAPKIERELKLLKEVGLDYLHLGESTPTLSGGEAQRLKLVTHLSHKQDDTLFVFDEPTIGLHPLDVKVLVTVMQKLLDQGATILTITHDLNLIVNSDYILDLGPHGGKAGGRIVAEGMPRELVKHPDSLTTRYLADYWKQFE